MTSYSLLESRICLIEIRNVLQEFANMGRHQKLIAAPNSISEMSWSVCQSETADRVAEIDKVLDDILPDSEVIEKTCHWIAFAKDNFPFFWSVIERKLETFRESEKSLTPSSSPASAACATPLQASCSTLVGSPLATKRPNSDSTPEPEEPKTCDPEPSITFSSTKHETLTVYKEEDDDDDEVEEKPDKEDCPSDDDDEIILPFKKPRTDFEKIMYILREQDKRITSLQETSVKHDEIFENLTAALFAP